MLGSQASSCLKLRRDGRIRVNMLTKICEQQKVWVEFHNEIKTIAVNVLLNIFHSILLCFANLGKVESSWVEINEAFRKKTLSSISYNFLLFIFIQS